MKTIDVFWPALVFLASALMYLLRDSVKKYRIAISGERLQTGPGGRQSDYQFVIQNLEAGCFDGPWTLELTQTQSGALLRLPKEGDSRQAPASDKKERPPRLQFLCGPIWTVETPEPALPAGVLYKVSGNQFPALTAWTLSCVTNGKEGNLAVRFTYGDTVISRAAGEESSETLPFAWYFFVFWFGLVMPFAAFLVVSGLVSIGPSGPKLATQIMAEDVALLMLFVLLDLLCLVMFAGNPAPRLHHRAGTD